MIKNGKSYTSFRSVNLKDGVLRFQGTLSAALSASDDKGIYVRGTSLYFWNGSSESEITAGGSTVYNSIGDPAASGSINFAAYTGTYTSSTANWGGLIISNTHANPTAGANLLTLGYTADGDEHGVFFICKDNSSADAKFTVGLNGATTIAGSATGTAALTITAGDLVMTSGVIDINIATGNAIDVNASKFLVAAATGNTTIAGTCDITGAVGIDGNFDVATTKFTVLAASGNTTIAGTCDITGATGIDGNFDVATSKFTVLAASGNTTVAGTLGVTGAVTLTAGLSVGTDLTVTGNFSFGGILTMAAEIRLDGNYIYFDADDNSGIYSSADNQIDIALNSAVEYSLTVTALDLSGNHLDNAGYLIMNAVTLPGGTEVYIGHDNTGDCTINAKTGKDVNIAVAGTDVAAIDENGIAFKQASIISTSVTTLTLTPTTDVVVTDAKGLIVGGAVQYSCGGVTAELEVTGTAAADGSLTLYTASATANANLLIGRDKAAALGGHDVLADNDVVGDISYCADDGTDTDTIVAKIRSEIDDAAPGASDIGGALVFMTASGAGADDVAEKLRINAAGDTCVANGYGIVVGAETQSTVYATGAAATLIPEFQVEGTAAADSAILVGRFSADAVGPTINMVKSRHATIGSATAVADNDVLGTIAWFAADTGDLQTPAATIYAEVDGTPGADDMPSSLVFATTADAGNSVTRRMSIGPAGAVYVGNEDANANMTIGITINQAGNDDQVLAFKSSDIATVLTTAVTNSVETDDFATFGKFAAITGGLMIQALGEDAAVTTNLLLESYGGTADTTKSTAGRALAEIYASEHNGANALADITANGNVFGVRARRGGADVALALLDEDGDLWLGNALDATTAYLTGSPTLTVAPNFVQAGGAANAITVTLNNLAGTGVTLTDGLTLLVDLNSKTLQAGANTLDFNGGGAVSIVSCRNVANNIGTAYVANGFIVLCYNVTATAWVDLSQ